MAHHYQQSDVQCGVAALQMALEQAGWDSPSAATLADDLDIDLQGTRPEALAHWVRDHGIAYHMWHGDVLLSDVKAFLADHAVMVCFFSDQLRDGHYACIHAIEPEEIILDDPWFGPQRRLPTHEFLSVWRAHPAGQKPLPNWMLAIQRRS